MEFKRQINLTSYKSSLFLLGPRMTGKSYLLAKLDTDLYFDLLDPELELRYKNTPRIFYDEITVIPKGGTIIVDEIQKVPQLLDYVQMGIEKLQHRFILSGSSARKLKRGGANLLAGRAISLSLHPLSIDEIGSDLEIDSILCFGTIPKICDLILQEAQHEARAVLRTYSTMYLKEEIQAEALVRNVGSFSRFLNIAAQFNGQAVVYNNLAASSGVPRSSVANYFDILEETLIATRLWEHGSSEKDKSKPKLYFFDCGVVRAIQDRLIDAPSPPELGHLFETFMFNELRKIQDYGENQHKLSYWKHGNEEIDFLVQKGNEIILAIECKSGRTDRCSFKFPKFKEHFPSVPIIVASLKDEKSRQLQDGIILMPWRQVLDKYKSM